MFDLDRWQEILTTIRQNLLRTILTGFAVFWGIFMLVILLGSGEGLKVGIGEMFKDDAVNSIFIRPGATSMPYKGTKPGRKVQFTNEDYELLNRKVDNKEYLTARLHFQLNATYKDNTGSFKTRAVHPEHRYLECSIMTGGRFLNDDDLLQFRKVTVLGDPLVRKLFPDGENPLGKYVVYNKIPFKVVGTYRDEGNADEDEIIYIPLSTAQKAFQGAPEIDQILISITNPSLPEAEKAMTDIKNTLASKHIFSPDDARALRVRSPMKEYERTMTLLDNISTFVWYIGVLTILAGIVGVSNIMMITVKDRTKEFGVRKALGAKPLNIITTIIQEALLITSVAGFIGLVAGNFVLEWASEEIKDAEMFKNPHVDFQTAMSATVLLIIAGIAAGLFPAIRAAKIPPIEALRED